MGQHRYQACGRGRMGCGASKVGPAKPEPGSVVLVPSHFPLLSAATCVWNLSEGKEKRGWSLPPLTAEQRAAWEAKKKLIEEQIARPSKWDEERLDASALKRALRNTKLLDAAWLAALADAGGVVPRCQDVPPEAIVTLEEMEKSGFTSYTMLSALVISYPWVRSCPAPSLRLSRPATPPADRTPFAPARPGSSTPTTPTRTGCS